MFVHPDIVAVITGTANLRNALSGAPLPKAKVGPQSMVALWPQASSTTTNISHGFSEMSCGLRQIVAASGAPLPKAALFLPN